MHSLHSPRPFASTARRVLWSGSSAGRSSARRTACRSRRWSDSGGRRLVAGSQTDPSPSNCRDVCARTTSVGMHTNTTALTERCPNRHSMSVCSHVQYDNEWQTIDCYSYSTTNTIAHTQRWAPAWNHYSDVMLLSYKCTVLIQIFLTKRVLDCILQ